MSRFWIRDWVYMCDACGSQDNAMEHLQTGSDRPNQREADAVMRQVGWQIGKHGVFCPFCRTDGKVR